MDESQEHDTPLVRSAPEAMTLLAELARVLKGRRFYSPGDPALALLFERAVRTWQVDLERHGAFEVAVEQGALRIPALGASGEVAGQFSGLVRALGGREVASLRVSPGIDADAFAGLIEVLVSDASALAAEGGIARALAMRAPDGIVVNGIDPVAAISAPSAPAPAPVAMPDSVIDEPLLPEPAFAEPESIAAPAPDPEPIATAEAEREPQWLLSLDDSAPQLIGEDLSAPVAFADETPTLEIELTPAAPEPDAVPSIEAFGEGELEPLELDESGEIEPPLDFDSDAAVSAEPAEADTNPFLAVTAPDLMGSPAEPEPIESAPGAGAEPIGPAPSAGGEGESFEFETIEEAPARARAPERIDLDGPIEAPPAPALVPELLEELDVCESGPSYSRMVERVTAAIELLVEQGHEPAAFPALARLFEHSGDGEKRPPMDREAARTALERLATGPCFAGLVERATGKDPSSLAATQILTDIGADAAGPLLREAAREKSAERRERIHGLLIALGEAAIPELLRAMEGDSAPRLRTAVRLAGEIQSPLAVDRLSHLLESSNAGLAQEVAKALVRIGDARAIEALVKAIASPIDPVPTLAVQALGTSGSERACEALLATLEQACDASRTELAREAIRALGRLGRIEAVPALAELLLRKSFFKRRQLRELKLAAASALGRLPGDEAVGALAQAAQLADAQIRRAAQMALDRRAHALAGR